VFKEPHVKAFSGKLHTKSAVLYANPSQNVSTARAHRK
jgi:hypothetical protein